METEVSARNVKSTSKENPMSERNNKTSVVPEKIRSYMFELTNHRYCEAFGKSCGDKNCP